MYKRSVRALSLVTACNLTAFDFPEHVHEAAWQVVSLTFASGRLGQRFFGPKQA
jgi:hypothetical protein